jgi:hypothetical protein
MLLQCREMADWRQIQARIRKAKNSPDAPTKLNELFQRTRDGMVAWELGAIEEKAERPEEAGRWYTIAAQRFRRADWRKKAEEALTRLGMEIPAPATPAEHSTHAAAADDTAADPHNKEIEESGEEADEVDGNRMPLALGEIPESNEEEDDDDVEAQPSGAPVAAGDSSAAGKRKRRRGRRGGRGRRRKGVAPASGLPSQAFAQTAEPQQARPAVPHVVAPAYERPPAPERVLAVEPAAAAYERPARGEAAAPQLPSERAAHGRGDPALASRMAHLESLLRRLVQSPLHRLDECDDAPAGPGVFLLSDSDQITSYYVEACQTLRIGTGNLARGGRSAKPQGRGARGGYSTESGLKGRLAEHLGINESKVSQYMKDHCVLRWIQLDDEAPMLAHFAIGVLRTPLNLE